MYDTLALYLTYLRCLCTCCLPKIHPHVNDKHLQIYNNLDSRVRILLKCRHCSQGAQFFLFLYFPSTCFFDIFLQNWNLQPWFSLGGPIPGSHSMGRGSLIFEGAHTNKTIGARFFYYGLSRIQDECEL
jgi:hypothetical protein